MLLAEIHGKRLDVARDNEDYLTSAVFGHLRFVQPPHFWFDFFSAAVRLSGTDRLEWSLGNVLLTRGVSLAAYPKLEMRFWRRHPTRGEPDLLLVFSGGPQVPLVVMIEVKLWAAKSGENEQDQLVRYLKILDDLDSIGVRVPAEAERYLVYLTPRESYSEVMASAASRSCTDLDRSRLFRVQWQDMLIAAEKPYRSAPEPASTILREVVAFLRRLGLEYFAGFTHGELPVVPDDMGAFYCSSTSGFRGFGREESLGDFDTVRGLWE